MKTILSSLVLTLTTFGAPCILAGGENTDPGATWQLGRPIVSYWCGPAMTDPVARQMAEGGFNLVWCRESELEVARRHGLRAQLTDGLLSPASLDQQDRREQLDALVDRVRHHPALYSYYIIDEPSAGQFPALGRLIAHLRARDPGHLAYINLFPTYANNTQLGTEGDTVTAYREHLRRYVEIVKPALVSYDHYQFMKSGEGSQYFLNLAMIRQAAQEARVPFLNIVQASSWAQSVRVPNTNEIRYLVYTTLAYGAQGISYYIYTCANHEGGIALADGTPTPIYHALKSYNPAFVAMASQLQPLRSLAVYHTALEQPGCQPPPPDARFRVVSSAEAANARGFLLALFGRTDQPSHVVVVNLDHGQEVRATVVGPGPLDLFEPTTGRWTEGEEKRMELNFLPGEGKLLRLL